MSLQKNISHPNCNPCITSALDSIGSKLVTMDKKLLRTFRYRAVALMG